MQSAMRRCFRDLESWQIIVGFALIGLVAAGASYAYAAFSNYSKPMNVFDFALITVCVILCPTQLVFVMCIDCEVIGWDGFILYSIIGALNVALYGLVGSAVAHLRQKPSHK
jgi:hypothetical protein